jgi:hypothetical protein
MKGRVLPGPYEGELVLFSDETLAYSHPLLTNIWSGSLSFPLQFTIDPP